jgi:flagellar basal body L-ring protein FlgH
MRQPYCVKDIEEAVIARAAKRTEAISLNHPCRLAMTGCCLVLFVLSGCAWFHPFDNEAVNEPVKPKPVAKPEPKSDKQLGSLWSESSKWNEFYARRTDRAAGDLVILYPSDGFRINVANRAGHAEVEVTRADRENNHIIAKITEVLPQHVYAITAKQTLKVGNRVHPIEFTGNIREQDIGPDDSASTDLIFNSNLVVESDTPSQGTTIKPKGPKVTMPYDQDGSEGPQISNSSPETIATAGKVGDAPKDIANGTEPKVIP